jgi:hypothetical protein
MDFEADFCDRCQKEKAFWDGYQRGDIDPEKFCPIHDRGISYYIGDPDFPKEWIVEDGEAKCTAFEEVRI